MQLHVNCVYRSALSGQKHLHRLLLLPYTLDVAPAIHRATHPQCRRVLPSTRHTAHRLWCSHLQSTHASHREQQLREHLSWHGRVEASMSE